MNLTYATIPGSPAPGIRVALQDADGATAWDFRIVDRSWMYDGTPMIAVEITHDAFGVFVDARPLLNALAEHGPDTLNEVLAILDRLGYSDVTGIEAMS